MKVKYAVMAGINGSTEVQGYHAHLCEARDHLAAEMNDYADAYPDGKVIGNKKDAWYGIYVDREDYLKTCTARDWWPSVPFEHGGKVRAIKPDYIVYIVDISSESILMDDDGRISTDGGKEWFYLE